MTRRDPTAYLDDIIAACEAVTGLVEGMGLPDYLADARTRWAVERQLEVAGEATRRFALAEPAAVECWRTDVREVAGFRNRLVHEYEALDDSAVFLIATTDARRLADDASAEADARRR